MNKENNKQNKIIKKAYEILERSVNGIKYSELIKKISEELPDIKINTIHGTIWYFKQDIDKNKIKDVIRPERGFYILKKYYNEEKNVIMNENENISEQEFYELFAEYLEKELEECTKAIPLGGHIFQDKWGTPDVIGIYKVLGIGQIQPLPEIVSAEIKFDSNQIITAFGQACSYKLFSHKVYLVIPKDTKISDIKRVESLCLKFGIGLILFNKNKEKPEFQILTRGIKTEPDYFYLNKYLRDNEDLLKKLL